jgi:hypothetical protein
MSREVTVRGADALSPSERRPVPGRLPMIAGMAVLSAAVPVPFLPQRALRHLRGAVAHDAAARHGLSLSSEARDALAEPSSGDRLRKALRRAAELVAFRLARPLAPVAAAARALEVYALGHLLDRYFAEVRGELGTRVLEPEARRIRRAIDSAAVGVVHPSLQGRGTSAPPASEDLRDDFTRWIDRLVLGAASLPSWLERRLDASFDEVVARSPELGHG